MSWNLFIWFAAAAVFYWAAGAFFAWTGRRTAAYSLSAAGVLVFFAFILGLWISLERPPLRTMGETRLWYAFFVAFAGLLVYVRWKYRWILSFSTLLSTVFICVNLLRPEIHSKTLMPALQSPWFAPHVIVYMFAYALLGAATLAAVYLLWKGRKTAVARDASRPHGADSAGGYRTASVRAESSAPSVSYVRAGTSVPSVASVSPESSAPSVSSVQPAVPASVVAGSAGDGMVVGCCRSGEEMPSAAGPSVSMAVPPSSAADPSVSTDGEVHATVDNLVYVGLAFLTFGMLFGALWAKVAWGHYWTWDPKETWAAVTWLCYLLYIHFRLSCPRRKQEALWLLLFAFCCLQMCWWGINYLPSAQGSSVHVYSS